MEEITIKDCIDLYNENLYDQDYDLLEYIKFIDVYIIHTARTNEIYITVRNAQKEAEEVRKHV